MADKTGIEWTDATWNPIVGCSVVSPGCTNCYAMSMAARIERMSAPRRALGDGRQTHYAGTTKTVNGHPVWTGKLAQAPEHILVQPLRWKRPRRIFVNSMSDLFHEAVPDEWIDQVFAVMALCPQHTFQVLTKRSARMRDYCSDPTTRDRIDRVMDAFAPAHWHKREVEDFGGWPLPNVWLGISAEDQRRADERVPDLLATPAAVRFVSAEPLLGSINFRSIDLPGGWEEVLPLGAAWLDRLEPGENEGARLDWIITGGESGSKARITPAGAAEAIRDQCTAAGVAFFHKQNGEWLASPNDMNFQEGFRWAQALGAPIEQHSDGYTYVRVGKHRAGRLLDGRTHDDLPARPA